MNKKIQIKCDDIKDVKSMYLCWLSKQNYDRDHEQLELIYRKEDRKQVTLPVPLYTEYPKEESLLEEHWVSLFRL